MEHYLALAGERLLQDTFLSRNCVHRSAGILTNLPEALVVENLPSILSWQIKADQRLVSDLSIGCLL